MKHLIEKIFPIARDLRCLPKSAWGYTLIMLINVARKTIFNVMNEVGDYSSVNQSTSLLLVFMALSFLVILKENRQIIRNFKRVKPIMAYHILGFMSFIWAGNFIPIAMKAGEVILAILLMVLTITKIKIKRVCLTYILFWCFVPVIFDLFSRRFSFFHTNLYTFSAAMGLMICLGGVKYQVYQLKEIRNIAFLLILFIIIGTSSASYISTIIGFIIFMSCGKRGIDIKKIIVCVVLALTIWNIGEESLKSYIFYGKNNETIESGTGRSAIWSAYWEMIKMKPILGWGFLVGERMLSTVFDFEVKVISAHNSFISSIVGMGFVGLLFFLNFIRDWLKTLYKQALHNNIYALIMLPAFAVFFVNTNSFPAIGTDWSYVGTAAYSMYIFSKMNL